MKLIGKGLVIDAERGENFPDYGDVEIDFGLAVALPSPAGFVLPNDAAITGKIAWYDLNAELLAAVTGDALSAGTVARAEAEPHQVPTEPPHEVELVETTVVPLSEIVIGDDNWRPLSEIVIGDDNWRLRRVDGTPGPDEYAVDGTSLAFHAARAGLYVYVDYFYSDAAGGKTVVVSPFSAPGAFKLLATLRLYDGDDGLYERELVLAARTGPLAAESPAAEPGSFGFAFAVENRVPGDVVVHFP
jgi:hypothetical protein